MRVSQSRWFAVVRFLPLIRMFAASHFYNECYNLLRILGVSLSCIFSIERSLPFMRMFETSFP